MRAITFSTPGGPEVLQLTEVPDPTPGPEQLLVRVRASALNRADTLQRRGQYPPPPGESDILGLELAGEVEAVGTAVQGFRVGDRVFGLVGGGGYAEKAVIDYRMAMPIPAPWGFVEAAAVPEVFLTANETLFTLGQLAPGETVLIHAGASGVGTAGIQMAHHMGRGLCHRRCPKKWNVSSPWGPRSASTIRPKILPRVCGNSLPGLALS
jgi:NADPH:quinone reductase-like Zn-dependent oxidoreductase